MFGDKPNFKGRPADIWAVGVTFFELFEGELPFLSKKIGELMEEV